MDSVLFNCTKGFATKFNLELPKKSYMKYGHYDKYWTTENRELLDYEFWRNLELYPWSLDIVKLVEKYDPDFRLLTACIRNEGCYSGKYTSVKQKLGDKYADKLITCYKDKTFAAANKNCILIDDKESNCVDWIKAGGTAYQWEERTEDMIEDSIEELGDLDFFLKTNATN